jgi:hypothetical protein
MLLLTEMVAAGWSPRSHFTYARKHRQVIETVFSLYVLELSPVLLLIPPEILYLLFEFVGFAGMTHAQRDRQTDRQTDRQAGRQRDSVCVCVCVSIHRHLN